jgi:trk system potassium uptake protein TrkA
MGKAGDSNYPPSPGQFAIIGLGRFGQRVAGGLYEAGAEVLAVDLDPDKVAQIKASATIAMTANAAHEETLAALGVDQMDAVVVAIGKDAEASILVTALLKQYGCRQIIARAASDLQARVLQMVGADRVVYPEDDEARRLVRVLGSPHVLDQIDLQGDLDVALLTAPAEFVGHSLVELQLRQRLAVNVVAIRQAETASQPGTVVFPDADYRVQADDRLYLVGSAEALARVAAME